MKNFFITKDNILFFPVCRKRKQRKRKRMPDSAEEGKFGNDNVADPLSGAALARRNGPSLFRNFPCQREERFLR